MTSEGYKRTFSRSHYEQWDWRKMTKAVAIWLSRGTAAVMGLAMLLALMVGLASTALAAVPGDPFKLGKLNAVTALVGKNSGPMLRLDNDSAAADARALSLEVEPGKAPLTVNASAGKATNLNVDELDGRSGNAFFSGRTYVVQDGEIGPGGGQLEFEFVTCDEGDVMLGGGGGGSVSDGDDLRSSASSGTDGWSVFVLDNNNPSSIATKGTCADFPPLRP